MTYVSVQSAPTCCGDVELLLWFCDFINRKYAIYHADILSRKLISKVQLWPVYLTPKEIAGFVARSYSEALKVHFQTNPNGPLPRAITYYPRYNTLRYVTKTKIAITLDMTTSLVLIQSFSPDLAKMYCDSNSKTIGPFAFQTKRLIVPSEVCGLSVPLEDAVRFL